MGSTALRIHLRASRPPKALGVNVLSKKSLLERLRGTAQKGSALRILAEVLGDVQMEKDNVHSFVLGAESGIQYTYTYAKIQSVINVN